MICNILFFSVHLTDAGTEEALELELGMFKSYGFQYYVHKNLDGNTLVLEQ